MSDLTDFWSLFERGRAFGYKDPIYAGGWHRGQDVPGASPVQPWLGKRIPLLLPGNLIYRGQKAKLGGVFVYDVGDEYHTYCHTRPLSSGGFRLSTAGDSVAWRGTSWAGPHLHFVVSKDWDAAWNTTKAVSDPRPTIRAVLSEQSEPAGGNSKPVPTPEDDMTPEESKKLDALYKALAVDGSESNDNLNFKIRQAWAQVRPGSSGRWPDGKLWSAVRDIQRKVGALDTSGMTDAQVDELANELKATLPPKIITALGQQLLKK